MGRRMMEQDWAWRMVVVVAFAILLAMSAAARIGATVLLKADTNRALVKAIELDYNPERPRLRVAVTVSGNFVKRAEYTNRETIRNVLEVLRFQKSRELFVTFEENRLLTFFVDSR